MNGPDNETSALVTGRGHRAEVSVCRDRTGRIEEVVVQVWDNDRGERLPTQQLSALASRHMPAAILSTYRPGIDGDGIGYVLGIYR